MPSVAIFNLEIRGYCCMGSASCGVDFKGFSLVNTELKYAFRILRFVQWGVLQDSIFFKRCDAYL